jgi:hypothetical protein
VLGELVEEQPAERLRRSRVPGEEGPLGHLREVDQGEHGAVEVREARGEHSSLLVRELLP